MIEPYCLNCRLLTAMILLSKDVGVLQLSKCICNKLLKACMAIWL